MEELREEDMIAVRVRVEKMVRGTRLKMRGTDGEIEKLQSINQAKIRQYRILWIDIL